MTELAVRYERRNVHVSVPRGSVTRVHLPDDDAKAHLVTAVLKARGGPDEELELFGTPATGLRAGEREQVRARIGAVSPVVGLITNLNAWENISLCAAYHGQPPLAQVARLADEVLMAFGLESRPFLSRLPDELGSLERKIASFVRQLVSAPELMLFDALEDGLTRAEARHAKHFEAVYRASQPAGTVIYVDTMEEA